MWPKTNLRTDPRIIGNCDETYSVKGRASEDAMLHQVLAYHLARQMHVPFVVASVDVAQCYDQMSHAMMALSSRVGKVPKNACNSLLQPLRKMEFFICTGYGESETSIRVSQK